ncbi:MAG: hypothetical protein HRT67_07055 [Flavobacteriaceae bacterium]|nr:hypothetical protein [Flavobacteriaceae bacterium]
MKTTATLFFFVYLLTIRCGFTQDSKSQVSIITGKINISRYHNYEQLNQKNKEILLNLYIERLEVILNILPNIAFGTESNVSIKSLGMHETKNNKKILKKQHMATANFIESSTAYQKAILPYSNKSDLVTAILFYEDLLKSLYTYKDFRND